MRSIKPGRGPSGMSFIGSIVAIIFGVFWTIIAVSITANAPFGIVGVIFPLFGAMFIILGVIQAIYNYKNATGKNRFSLLDITDSPEEGDPSDRLIRDKTADEEKEQKKYTQIDFNYCPFCGLQLDKEYVYCPKCGKETKFLLL